MLIMSFPKSASTSLLFTLGKITNLPATRLDKLGTKVPEYNLLPHTDLVKLNDELASKFASPIQFFQQHIAPIEFNMNLIKQSNTNFIITLREPDESYKAYFRQPDILNHLKLLKYRYSSDVYRIFRKQLSDLYDKYLSESKSNPNSLLIKYKELTTNPHIHLNKALELFGLEQRVDSNIELLKYRYTNNGKLKYRYD